MSLRMLLPVALVLSLAACAPLPPVPTSTSSSSRAPSVTPSAEVAVATDADPADFLLEGTPGVFDADGFWKGHYGFFTDDTKSVRCDLYIFSGDSGGVNCAITLGNEALRSYVVPANVSTECDLFASNSSDGYSVGINVKVFETGAAGYTDCRLSQQQADPAVLAATGVLGENQTLRVDTDHEHYTCSVAAGVASCTEATSGASFRFGTGVAEFEG